MSRIDATASEPVQLRTETFACQGLQGFTFDYPVFRDWEVKRIEAVDASRCRILLSWPSTIEFEVAPQVYVHRRVDLAATSVEAVAAVHAALATAAQTPAAANPNRVLSDRVHDPSRWTPGYQPKPDQWDYLHFYGPSFGVRIGVEAWGDEHGFSRARFANEIVRTFRFTHE